MKDVVYITGNQNKANYLAQLLGHPVTHQKVDLTEIQSLDIKEVVRHKLYEAYAQVNRPVLVEDTALEFLALGKLPGTFIKWFEQEMSLGDIAGLVKDKDRSAIVRCTFGYFDGDEEHYFEGSMKGTIADSPRGTRGFGFDAIFIPEGYEQTRAELSPEDDKKTYKIIKPLDAVRDFLSA